MITAFIRTYSNQQDSGPQENTIRGFADAEGKKIEKWIKSAGNSQRANQKLEKIVQSSAPGDEIWVSDISRISPKIIQVLHILLLCIERGVAIRSLNDGYQFEHLSDNSTQAFTYALVSEIERKLVSVRTKEALASIRNKGVALGRPKDTDQPKRIKTHKRQIEKDLNDPSLTQAQVAEKYHISPSSLKHFQKTRFSRKIRNGKK